MISTSTTRYTPQVKSALRLRAAVLAAFASVEPSSGAPLTNFSQKEWKRQLHWLDESGLALYLVAHLRDSGQQRLLPQSISKRLEQNLRDNKERNDHLFAETVAISHALEDAGVLFATLKGISLSPESVPDPSLRCQLDIDFLVSEKHADTALRVLQRFGYTRKCVSGSTWEFVAGAHTMPSVRDLYKIKPQRSAEIHLAAASAVLGRTEMRSFNGTNLRTLAPADLFVSQALHLFKHIRGAFTRSAWLLEFHRHLIARHADHQFWRDLEDRLTEDSQACLAVAVVANLSHQIFAGELPPYINHLAANHLPAPVEMWIRNYALTYLLASYPGSKLNLLLQTALANSLEALPDAHPERLVPRGLPPMITLRAQNESAPAHLKRLFVQFRFTLFRLRFHCVEGLRYCIERPRFRRRVAELAS
jgi:hypothetical protein